MLKEEILSIKYSVRRQLGVRTSGYVTTASGEICAGSNQRLLRLRLSVAHLGAAFNAGLDPHLLIGQSSHAHVLSQVIDDDGHAKALGPWEPPISPDVAILDSLVVEDQYRSRWPIAAAVVDAVRAFGGSCGYLLYATQGDPDRKQFGLSLLDHGFYPVARELLGLALDYPAPALQILKKRYPQILPELSGVCLADLPSGRMAKNI